MANESKGKSRYEMVGDLLGKFMIAQIHFNTGVLATLISQSNHENFDSDEFRSLSSHLNQMTTAMREFIEQIEATE